MQISKRDFLKRLGVLAAAGVAGAALAARKGVTPRALPYADLRRELERQKVWL